MLDEWKVPAIRVLHYARSGKILYGWVQCHLLLLHLPVKILLCAYEKSPDTCSFSVMPTLTYLTSDRCTRTFFTHPTETTGCSKLYLMGMQRLCTSFAQLVSCFILRNCMFLIFVEYRSTLSWFCINKWTIHRFFTAACCGKLNCLMV